MKFKSEVSILITIIILAAVGLLGYSLAITLVEEESLGIQITLIAVVSIISAFLIWMLLNTYYTITKDKIHWRSAFLRGTITISSIEKIQKRTTMLAGLKPAVGLKGIIITYSTGKRIYLSPKRQDEFIEEVLKLNGKIVIE